MEQVFSTRKQTNAEGKVVLCFQKSGRRIRKVLVLKDGNLVAASVGRRKITMIHGMAYLACQSKFHKGKRLRPATDFHIALRSSGVFLQTECRRCYNERRGRSRPTFKTRKNHGRIRIAKVRPHLLEIIERCGGKAPACRALGISTASLSRWLGDSKESVKFIQAENAALILKVLRDLRSGKITEYRRKPGTKPVVLEH